MEIFIRNIPFHATEKELKTALQPHVNDIGVFAYAVRIFTAAGNQKRRDRCGTLTLPTPEAGLQFLEFFGRKPGDTPPRIQIWVLSRQIACGRSNRPVDEHLIKSLVQGQQDKLLKKSQRTQPIVSQKLKRNFEIDLIECGVWSPQARSVPLFEAYYSRTIHGKLLFKTKEARIEFTSDQLDIFDPKTLGPLLSRSAGHVQANKTISMPYHTIASIITSDLQVGEVIFTLSRAPSMYRQIISGNVGGSDLEEVFQSLGIQGISRYGEEALPVERVSSLDEDHACFAPFAFVYRFRLKEVGDFSMIERLNGKNGIPEIRSQRTSLRLGQVLFAESFQELAMKIQTDFDFPVAFQLNALFANGILPPYVILSLLPQMSEMIVRFGTTKTAAIMEDFISSLDPADPLGELDALSYDSLIEILRSCIDNVERLRSPAMEAHTEAGMTYIYHATITPAGCYFYGPKLEMQNRVLRKYPDHHQYFMRVIFCEEDGDQLMFEPRISQRPIYDGQYRYYLSPENKLVVAGRPFQFLGFSASSLRTNSCWFMAPFTFKGEQLDAAKVIANLGDFSSITCPGRCAARIGQAFSDTFSSIYVPPDSEVEIPDIERNGRCFSDGVGKISQEMLEYIWAGSEKLHRQKSTAFQIRFAGAKGVVSLDTRLEGSQLCLRPSMIKFRGSTDRNLEICSSPGWLPMVLNRPLIKVLEDLKVQQSTFMDLQQDAVKELRDSTKSAAFAANFLKRQRIASGSIRLPWMIEALHNLGLEFRDDDFLERAFELSLLTALRDLKHRARIPVPKGVTLVGIVDETGILEEGEIYCPYKFSNGDEGVVEGYVLITRSPVHHPGDVQMAIAVQSSSIPLYSPLRELSNVVVFSQKGSRDLPSMLSGGDLDGDLYNIIYDERFSLGKLYNPAEYTRVPPQDLGRAVKSEDIVDFFLDFMQNNLLGLISHRHLVVADQKLEGVKHPDCLMLAEMASTAVDFPKTGIKVDKFKIPRCSPAKPDFMAPGPRMFVQKDRALYKMEDYDEDDADDDVQVSYYESEKVLGHLYRAIDEKKFLREMKAEVADSRQGREVMSVIDGVWDYVEHEIPGECDWTERLKEAEEIKDSYEKSVRYMMRNYSDTPWSSTISEVEVFISCIVGRERQTRRQKERSAEMKEEFERLAASIIYTIKGECKEDAFGLGMACLFLCKSDRERLGPQNALQSFAWITASALLTEVDKMQRERNGMKKKRREFY